MSVVAPITEASADTPAADPTESTASGVARPRRRRSVAIAVSFAWLGMLAFFVVFANHLPLASAVDGVAEPRQAPFTSWSHPLGVDALGRDVVSRLVFGARASLAVGLVAVLIGMLVGTAVGLTVGYFAGIGDWISGLVNDTLLAFPGLILLLALGATLGPGVPTLVIGLGLISIPLFVRVSRANTKRYAQVEFVEAARSLGVSHTRILFREVLPNVWPPTFAFAVVLVATFITVEAALSFLGLGLRPPTPSWGSMIDDGRPDLAEFPYLVLVPAAVLALTVFALNTVGDFIQTKLGVSTGSGDGPA